MTDQEFFVLVQTAAHDMLIQLNGQCVTNGTIMCTQIAQRAVELKNK